MFKIIKKLNILLLVLLLSLGVSAAFHITAYAEEDDFGINIPDDAFDGDSNDFDGKDGSLVTVYDNGSIMMAYPDGSITAIDYNGNQYTWAANGTASVKGTNGNIQTDYPDGSSSNYYANENSTYTRHADGTITQEMHGLGIAVEMNAEGEKVAVGFIGGTEKLAYDEDGDVKEGEITGPKGEKITITKDPDESVSHTNLVLSNGTNISFDEKPGQQTTSISYPDGTRSEETLNYTLLFDGNHNYIGVSNTIEGAIHHPDGTKGEYISEYDEDLKGNITSGSAAAQMTDTDGSAVWFDMLTNKMEFKDPNTGNYLRMDGNGNITDMKSEGEIEFHAEYDEHGNMISSRSVFGDGSSMETNADGSTSYTTADGTNITMDSEGNVYKNGEHIRLDDAEGHSGQKENKQTGSDGGNGREPSDGQDTGSSGSPGDGSSDHGSQIQNLEAETTTHSGSSGSQSGSKADPDTTYEIGIEGTRLRVSVNGLTITDAGAPEVGRLRSDTADIRATQRIKATIKRGQGFHLEADSLGEGTLIININYMNGKSRVGYQSMSAGDSGTATFASKEGNNAAEVREISIQPGHLAWDFMPFPSAERFSITASATRGEKGSSEIIFDVSFVD